ncbi:MAG: hypothetical protein ACI90V_006397 [Bacillariaceae sp.]|jgi:hypothetical protein
MLVELGMMLGLDEGGWGFIAYFNTSTERMYRLAFTSICKSFMSII